VREQLELLLYNILLHIRMLHLQLVHQVIQIQVAQRLTRGVAQVLLRGKYV
jgi:hypothetical protein